MTNWANPLVGSSYVNYTAEITNRDLSAVKMMDSATVSDTNVPIGAKRWNSGTSLWEKWNGTAWVIMAASYGISITGSAGSVPWSGVTSRPTTLAGYGITDAAPATGSTAYLATSGNAVTATTATTATNLSGGAVAATTISASGLISATGGQVKFPATQVPSADVNTLDDYEEGTWTPAFALSFPGTSSFGTYVLQAGTYTKIGRQVTATFSLKAGTFALGTGFGTLTIAGLPFTVGGTAYFIGAVFSQVFSTLNPSITFAAGGTSALTLHAYVQATGQTQLTQAHCATNMEVTGTVVYFV